MKVAIAGYGVEGKASLVYWQGLGAAVAIADERLAVDDAPAGIELLLGEGAFGRLNEFDIIVRSPSVAPSKLPYGDKVTSATNEFFAHCPAPIIGVTGTKGKGTTASLIASILRAGGNPVHLVGNIGTPALEVLASVQSTDIVVFELSSFQLWDIKKSPNVAVVLAIEPDHLDVHSSYEDYIAAKANIVRYQTAADVVVYNTTNEVATRIANGSLAQKIAYPFAVDEVAASLRIPGAHNVENASAAIAAVRQYVQDAAVIRQGLSDFTGLPHRLKFVATKNDVSYYDDSIATTPGSAIAAMRSFSEPKVLILGGSDKGADYREVAVVAKETATTVLAIGQTGDTIMALCQEMDVPVERETGLMHDVVSHASALSQAGGVVLLSPASASFDQYKSYVDRGDQFIQAVQEL